MRSAVLLSLVLFGCSSGESTTPASVSDAGADTSEVVVLATCNRTEVYLIAERFHGAYAEVRDFFADLTFLPPERFAESLYVHYDDQAVRHLFEVAAGLDSAVPGEHEILGQVRDAWELARVEGTARRGLNLLFRHALEVGKRARTETSIARHVTSVSQAAVILAGTERRPLLHDRVTALRRLDLALARTVVLGVETNIAFLRTLCAHDRVVSGDLDTGLIETMLPFAAGTPDERMLAAAAAATVGFRERDGVSPLWHDLEGWRIGERAPRPTIAFLTDDDQVLEAPEGAGGTAATAIDADGAVWVSAQGSTVRLRRLTRRARMDLRLAEQERASKPREPEGRAPMPGSIVAVHVADGDAVRAGEPIVSIEAMKMEHPVLAPHDGTVHLLVALGDQVRRDQPVARVSEQETA